MIFTWPLWLIYGLRRRNRFVLRFYRPRSATGDLRWRHLAFYVFTCRSALPAPFGDSIFRCTAKDRGERRASSSQAPHPSFCLSGQKLSRSAAPPLPTKPTSLGFGGAPVGGPLDPRSNVLGHSDVLCANRSATVHLTRLSRLRCREANTLGVRSAYPLASACCAPKARLLHRRRKCPWGTVPRMIARLTQPTNCRLLKTSVIQ